VRRRFEIPEFVDLRQLEPAELESTYRFLAFFNGIGGGRAIRNELRRYSRAWTGPVRILDVGSGSAGVARMIARWARRAGLDVSVTGLDLSPQATAWARRESAGIPKLTFVRGDARALPFAEGSFDYVICSLFLHHLSEDDIVSLLRGFARLAVRGFVLADVLRRRRAWLWAKLVTLFGHAVVRHDGPLSVRRSFTLAEIGSVAARAGLPWLRARPVPGHHFLLSGERPGVRLQSSR
jgi:SAM-dependent methyltransferase